MGDGFVLEAVAGLYKKKKDMKKGKTFGQAHKTAMKKVGK